MTDPTAEWPHLRYTHDMGPVLLSERALFDWRHRRAQEPEAPAPGENGAA